MNTTKTYELNDFKTIKNEGFSYELPEYALALINKISRQVGAPSYIKTPVFRKNRYNNQPVIKEMVNNPQRKDNKNKKRRNRGGNHGGARELTDSQWNSIRSFEETRMEKAKDDCEKAINEIRSLLNKLSEGNYDTIKDEVLFKIYELQQLDVLDVSENSKLWYDICELIVNTSYNNAFYSVQYVKLLKDIYNKYNNIKNQFKNVLKKSIDIFYDIKYVDPETDYEEFCKNNIVSKHRRSLGTFIKNLFKTKLISKDEYTEILFKVINIIKKIIDEENKKYIAEELCQVIFSLMESNYKMLVDIDEFNEYFEDIEKISEMKRKEHPSLTNKVIFKFCDIVDAFAEL